MMNLKLVLVLTLLSIFCKAQELSGELNLAMGKYSVGYKHYVKADPSRTYYRIYDWNNTAVDRPMSISIWYPAKENRKKSPPLKVIDYLSILKSEEEWESLPDDRILSWFYYPDTKENRVKSNLTAFAIRNAKPFKGKFPVVVYAPSYEASSVENFALCESLASHGFVVISSPSRGTENRFLSGGTTKDIETQARDIEFLMAEASTLEFCSTDNIVAMGFSFGGISNVLAQMRNKKIKAVVCLDGSIKYQLEKLLASPYAEMKRVDVPFLFMTQKDIPREVMLEDNIDTTLNQAFPFFDSLQYSDAYSIKFNHLTHAYFSTMGVLFQPRDTRQDKSDREINESYRLVNAYVIKFMQAQLNNDADAATFLNQDPLHHGISTQVITMTKKSARLIPPGFEDFNVLAQRNDYKRLEELYADFIQQHPGAKLDEWKLNNLGLQLVFRGKENEGINVLLFTTTLFPQSANAFDSLAESYFVQGNKKLARYYFERSLVLDPSNINAATRLKQLND